MLRFLNMKKKSKKRKKLLKRFKSQMKTQMKTYMMNLKNKRKTSPNKRKSGS
jgi:hypothetical protein